MANQRDIVFDIMKGIGILSVLVGHWPGINEAVKTFVYSFHIPLFFLISGYFTQTAFSLQGMKKSARRLVIPFLFTQLLIIGWYVFWGGRKIRLFAVNQVSIVIGMGQWRYHWIKIRRYLCRTFMVLDCFIFGENIVSTVHD